MTPQNKTHMPRVHVYIKSKMTPQSKTSAKKNILHLIAYI